MAAKDEQSSKVLLNELDSLCKEAKRQNIAIEEVWHELIGPTSDPPKRNSFTIRKLLPLLVLFLSVGVAFVKREEIIGGLLGDEERCVMSNNPLVMEIGRPLADCGMCEGLDSVPVYDGISRAEFADKFAYSNKPVLVKNATAGWSTKHFSFQFFRDLYRDTPGAVKVTEEECQFFEYNTNLESLSEFFAMSDDRAALKHDSWYIGWSNCDPTVKAVLRKHYRQPLFLPRSAAESDDLDWIFMGGAGPGAFIHLDHVDKTSWQAQLSGTKTWTLIPPPECEAVCKTLEVTVNTGDICKWIQ
jgi:hypothetical protein